MSFTDLAKKVGKAAVKGTATYLEHNSDFCARDKRLPDETREEYEEFSDRMARIREEADKW